MHHGAVFDGAAPEQTKGSAMDLSSGVFDSGSFLSILRQDAAQQQKTDLPCLSDGTSICPMGNFARNSPKWAAEQGQPEWLVCVGLSSKERLLPYYSRCSVVESFSRFRTRKPGKSRDGWSSRLGTHATAGWENRHRSPVVINDIQPSMCNERYIGM